MIDAGRRKRAVFADRRRKDRHIIVHIHALLKTPLFFAVLALSALAASPPPADTPENIGLGLRQVVENFHRDKAEMRASAARSGIVQMDGADRVIVNIHLDGKVTSTPIGAPA